MNSGFNSEQNSSTADGNYFYASNATLPCVKVENGSVILDVPSMIVGLRYDFEFEGRQMFAIKNHAGALDIYEIRSWWRDFLHIMAWVFRRRAT